MVLIDPLTRFVTPDHPTPTNDFNRLGRASLSWVTLNSLIDLTSPLEPDPRTYYSSPPLDAQSPSQLVLGSNLILFLILTKLTPHPFVGHNE